MSRRRREPVEVICQYCARPARRALGAELYPRTPAIAQHRFYRCDHCDAHVGCHQNSPRWMPLGSLANRDLRILRIQAHHAFDRLWRGQRLTRTAAYRALAAYLLMDPGQCHIGRFDEDQCRRTITFAGVAKCG